MNELWKDVHGFEGLYMISNLGKIKSIDHYVKCNTGKRLVKGRVLKACDRGNGYPFVTLGKDGKQYNMSIHRMVAIAFVPNPQKYKEVNHIDENKSNFHVENLEWCDRNYNNNHGTRQNRVTIKNSKKVIQMEGDKVLRIWFSLSDIARELNFSIGNISSCCNGSRPSAYGYVWKYESEVY